MGFDEFRTECSFKGGCVGCVLGERPAGDEVCTRGFGSLVDVFHTVVYEGQTAANEWCGFVWEHLNERFLGRHDG